PAPRLGVAYSLTGDGKTALKATWGRFNWIGNPGDGPTYNGNATASTTYRWVDLNGDKQFQRGEEGAFVSATGASTSVINPNLQQAKTYETAVVFERELRAYLADALA